MLYEVITRKWRGFHRESKARDRHRARHYQRAGGGGLPGGRTPDHPGAGSGDGRADLRGRDGKGVRRQESPSVTPIWITGLHPVEELLASRSQSPQRVLLSKSVPERTRDRLSGIARSAGVPCLSCSREEWHRRTGEREGGGIGAEIESYRYSYNFV